MKKIIIAILGITLLIAGAWFFSKNKELKNFNKESIVLEKTYNLSKEYLLLRYRTDNILLKASEYADYASWDAEMTILIKDWDNFEKKSLELEESANKIAETTAINFNTLQTARAYDYAEVQAVVEKAPMGRQIRTLAKHFGVDVKKAQLILNQSQDMATKEAWGEAGDTFEKLENQAIVIKDGCKVAGYVGGVVITGGAAGGFAAAGTLAQVTTVVVGVDLALEVTEDTAQIAFGDKNKVSSFVKGVRTVTEPVASVLTITNIPGNLGSAYGKFDSVMVGLEQFRESAQEGKVIGVDLKNFEYHSPFQRIKQAKYPGTVSAAEMEMAEVEEWLKSLNTKREAMTIEEVEEFLKSSAKEAKQEEIVEEKELVEEVSPAQETETVQEVEAPDIEQPQETSTGSNGSQSIAGNYSASAILQHVEEDVEADESLAVTLQLNESGTGTATVYGYSGDAQYAGNSVSFSVTMKENGAVVNCSFKGKASQSGSQTAISGNLYCSMMGVTFATYSWSAQ